MKISGQPTDMDRTRVDARETPRMGGASTANADKAREISPIAYISRGDPPVLTVHGTADRGLRYDHVRLHAALEKAGVPSYSVSVREAGHGELGTIAAARVKVFFDKFLRGQRVEVPTSAIDMTQR